MLNRIKKAYNELETLRGTRRLTKTLHAAEVKKLDEKIAAAREKLRALVASSGEGEAN